MGKTASANSRVNSLLNMLKRIYMVYGMMVFGGIFLLCFIFFLIPIALPKQFRLAGLFNRWWGKALFFFIAMPYKIEHRASFDTTKRYIFCPNHFSWLDIPTMGLVPCTNMVFVGKSEIESVPVFGWMYKRLHITINRKQFSSMQSMLDKACLALKEGKSLCIFPEGGIKIKKRQCTSQGPQLSPFKTGAFRIAIEEQISIVPVTIPNNWRILTNKPMLLTHGVVKVVFHTPIEVTGMKVEDVDILKEKVYTVIDKELKRHDPGISDA